MIPSAVVDDCRHAAELLERAQHEGLAALQEQVREAQRRAVCARDALIHALRRHPDAERRDALDRVNTSLSLIVGTEYPLGALHRSALGQARDLLRTLAVR